METTLTNVRPMICCHGMEPEDIAHDMHEIALELITDLKDSTDMARKEKLITLIRSVLMVKDCFMKMTPAMLPCAVLS